MQLVGLERAGLTRTVGITGSLASPGGTTRAGGALSGLFGGPGGFRLLPRGGTGGPVAVLGCRATGSGFARAPRLVRVTRSAAARGGIR
ncbi:hypothetical protein [Streptomyces lydicus]|uniref:hypothetical protein n=1 Tax=Streptomyces lydicus TaxID=47763 RepID=UPI001F395F39|nr:hypothetical protein [Streptomyces lydicus]